ncbi:MAG: mechanosensitive ion channel family protein [Myxococcales bacterium]|nr:mechanosensitive ion channel family protein [Myxococcales bacterium]MDH3483004.1 mechanosensitive ion channel family protein [Myxococcales bacterium]
MKTRKTLILIAAILGQCLVPALALAQDATTDEEVVSYIKQSIRWGGVVTSLFVILGVWITLRFFNNFIENLGDQFTTRRMLFQKIGTIVQFFVYIITIAAVLALSIRIDNKVLALLGGTAAVAIGFAVRDLVASFIAGVMIMIDQPFQVGDRVAFGGEYGDITAIGLRSVRLQTLSDNTVTIPNNRFLTDITSCGNYGALDMQVVMDFYVGVDQDVMKARDIVTEAGLTSRYVHLPKPVVVLVSQVMQDNYIAVRLRLKAYVLDTKYENAFETDVHLRVMHAFEDYHIGPPAILHRTIAAGSGSEPLPA